MIQNYLSHRDIQNNSFIEGYEKNIPELLDSNSILVLIFNNTYDLHYVLPSILSEHNNQILSIVSGNISKKDYSNIFDKQIQTSVKYQNISETFDLLLNIINSDEPSYHLLPDILIMNHINISCIDTYAIIKMCLYCKKYKPSLKIILPFSSSKNIQKYLNKILTKKERNECFIYHIPEQYYPIQIRYYDKSFKPGNPELYEELCYLIYDLNFSSSSGNFLVYLPAIPEINTVIDILKQMLQNRNLNKSLSHISSNEFKTFSPILYDISEIDNISDILNIIQSQKDNQRIIFFSTDIPKFGIDLKLGTVLDSMLHVCNTYSTGGGKRSKLTFIPYEESIKRLNVLGRFNSGIYYRFMSSENYKNLPYKKFLNQNLVLNKLYLNGISIPILKNILNTLHMQSFQNFQIMIDTLGLHGKHQNNIIDFINKFPLGIRNSVLLWYWYKEDLPMFPGIVISSFIDSAPNYFTWPHKQKFQKNYEYNLLLHEHYQRHFFPIQGYSDIETYLNLWNILMDDVGGLNASSITIKRWCIDNSINYSKISEVIAIINKCLDLCKNMNIKCEIGPFTTSGVLDVIQPLIHQTYSDKILNLVSHNNFRVQYIDPKSHKYYKLSSWDGINQLSAYPPDQIYSLLSSSISSPYMHFNVVNCAFNVHEIKSNDNKIISNDITSSF